MELCGGKMQSSEDFIKEAAEKAAATKDNPLLPSSALLYYNSGHCIICNSLYLEDPNGYWCNGNQHDDHYYALDDNLISVDCIEEDRKIYITIDLDTNKSTVSLITYSSGETIHSSTIERKLSLKEIMTYLKFLKDGSVWW